jgi:hypothetical protein
MARHYSLVNASRASGLAVDELLAIIARDVLEPLPARAA